MRIRHLQKLKLHVKNSKYENLLTKNKEWRTQSKYTSARGVFLLFSLQVFTTVCSSSDSVGSVSSLCVEVWSPLLVVAKCSTRVLMMTRLHLMLAGPYLSSLTLHRCVVKQEMVSTSIHGQNYDLWPRIRGWSEVSTEAGSKGQFA
jgi:hypothetical protein